MKLDHLTADLYFSALGEYSMSSFPISPFISGPLDCLLNLNSRKVEVYFYDDLFSDIHSNFVFPPMLNRSIATDRAEKFELNIVKSSFDALTNLENLSRERLRAMVTYVLERCPNLKTISVGYVGK